MRLDEQFPQRTAAALAGLPRGSVAAWQHQRKLPAGRRYDLADCMSLKAAAELAELGLELGAAAAIAWMIKPDWVDVAPLEEAIYLVVWPTPPGAEVPYEFAVQTADQTLGSLERGRGVRLVRLDRIAREVLVAAAEHAKYPTRQRGRPRSRL